MIDVVQDGDDGVAARGAKLLQAIEQIELQAGIERRQRFVDEYQAIFHIPHLREDARQLHPGLLATGQRVQAAAKQMPGVRQGGRVLHDTLQLGVDQARHPPQADHQRALQSEGHVRALRQDGAAPRQVGQRPLRQRPAREYHLSRLRMQFARHQFQQGRLARAAGTEDGDALAGRHPHIEGTEILLAQLGGGEGEFQYGCHVRL